MALKPTKHYVLLCPYELVALLLTLQVLGGDSL